MKRLLLTLILLQGACLGADKPNFVIFFTDDQGYNDVGCFGSPLIKTPHIDRMAEEGLRLTSFYVQPVCGVSRAALMTGCYPIRVGEPANRKNLHTILHPEEYTIAELLRDAGYSTGMIGKWHLAGGGRGDSWNRELLPNAQGFDYWFGAPSHNGTTRVVPEGRGHTELMRNGEIVDPMIDQEEMAFLTRQYTEEALEFIRRKKDKPFFLYLAHTMPHVPINATEDFLGKSERGLYGDVIEELDWSLGQVLSELERLGLDDNTLVLFTSDNGPWIEDHLEGDGGTDSHCGSADPLRGAKMMTWEGGIRVPAVMRWPGHIREGRVSDDIVSSLDIYPTLAGLAGADLPGDRTIDGVDQGDFLLGRSDRSARDTFFYYAGTHLHAVRWKNWKLIRQRAAKPAHLGWWARMVDEVPAPFLVDLSRDIAETENRAASHPEIVAELDELIAGARDDLGDWDTIGKGARYFDDAPKKTARELSTRKAPRPKLGVMEVTEAAPFEPLGELRFDFESTTKPMEGWKVVKGDIPQPVSKATSLPRHTTRPFQRSGSQHLSTAATLEDAGASDGHTGVIESPTLVINGKKVAFLLSGGGPGAAVSFVDLDTGKEFIRTEGSGGPQMKRYIVEYPDSRRGKKVRIRLVDEAKKSWGHLCFDDFSADGMVLNEDD